MIENWIDELAKVWEFSDGRFGTVHSYRLIEKAEFPDSIDASTLDNSPVALTIPASLKAEYSEGGPHIGFWSGVTEFHVAPDLDRGRLPALLPWYGMILKAASSHMQLNNTVEYFALDERDDQIEGPMPLQYGEESPHWGFLVHWRVKERLEGSLTVSR
jgi:hypothetical protein